MLGLARQGEAAAAALERHGVAVVRADRKQGNDADLTLLAGVEVLVKSGGVPNEVPLAAAALARGIPVWSDVEVAFRLLRNPFLAVTGTNGKTTTTALLGEIFRAAGRPAAVAGNIGRAVCSLDGALEPDVWVVCELSSFQLEHVDRFRARVAVLLNLAPDHLDRHGTFEAYRAAKLRVFENQRPPEDWAVVPRGFRDAPGRARILEFAADDPLPAEPRLRGRHNRENAAAACAAARAVGIRGEAIAEALRSFPGVPHRLELVGEVGGVAYVNDSKATNVAAALPAFEAYADMPLHLILGGSLKSEPFAPLADALGSNVQRVYLVGEAADALALELDRRGAPYERSGDLDTAVRAAAAAARAGEVVLLSPACASYDQFRDFEQRGDRFRALVRSLAR
ncbi:MAG: UDP-N-acetylmuramoyl-L-alanine--D-glutamate ligase [Thermoleophilia bacterium]|nr:UDP-N-acetylmuramoyl-L-alanine--D-glutamate ligase [Thermoleophilia bacterium]